MKAAKTLLCSSHVLRSWCKSVGWCCRCHVEMDLAVARCPGEAVLGADRLHTCAEGYTGTTCNSCMDGFGMSSDRVCEACEDSGYTLGSFLMLAGVIVGLMLAIFILGRIWKGLKLKHILRCAFQVKPPGWSILVPSDSGDSDSWVYDPTQYRKDNTMIKINELI